MFIFSVYLALAATANVWLFSFAYLAIGVAFTCIAISCITSKTSYIELNDSGEIQLNQCGQYQLLASSRLTWIGCWLLLKDAQSGDKKITYLFVFKDSLSGRDYARLCRWVLRFKFNELQESTR
ncbi:protein YgfX [Thalassotalea marina]|uniref:Uncharacterized protein n=1 Tax=Thalassotalea marina TaxID=1673741 RepID=A0A919BEP6_9GAMM|nr:protein YgfX [Thalassotalea marina]GHF84476.1 hypothetical protein GCM10017161_09880 [Thalassotalea marina]